MKEPRFGAALPDTLREPQRIVTTDPAPHLPFCNSCEPGYPTLTPKEKGLCILAGVIALGVLGLLVL